MNNKSFINNAAVANIMIPATAIVCVLEINLNNQSQKWIMIYFFKTSAAYFYKILYMY